VRYGNLAIIEATAGELGWVALKVPDLVLVELAHALPGPAHAANAARARRPRGAVAAAGGCFAGGGARRSQRPRGRFP